MLARLPHSYYIKAKNILVHVVCAESAKKELVGAKSERHLVNLKFVLPSYWASLRKGLRNASEGPDKAVVGQKLLQNCDDR